jgi:hypothetical protein
MIILYSFFELTTRMLSPTDDIAVRPQESSWLLFILMNLMLALIATSIAQMGINFIWWGLFPILFLFFIVLVHGFLMKPVEIKFCGGSKRIDVAYRFSYLTKRSRTFTFADAESIQSRFGVTGDNVPEVRLEITIKNQGSLLLMSATPDWSPTGPLLGYAGCLEPKKLEVLRLQIAKLTGIKDRGFLRT